METEPFATNLTNCFQPGSFMPPSLINSRLTVIPHTPSAFISTVTSLNSYDSILPTLPIANLHLEKKYGLCEQLVLDDLMQRDRAYKDSVDEFRQLKVFTFFYFDFLHSFIYI